MAAVERTVFAKQSGSDLTIYFQYASYDAEYTLPKARLEDFDTVIKNSTQPSRSASHDG